MRLLLAHQHDAAAHELADRWGHYAVLLTPAELSAERLFLRLDGDAQAALPSRPEVTAVLTRLGGITPAELAHIHPDDATYAAAELDAFLKAWLGVWPGPVINRPSTTSLNGPGWRREQWAAAAAAVGLRTVPVHRSTEPVDGSVPTGNTRVTVVGREWFGATGADLGRRLCALASLAGCTTLEALLDDDVIVHVSAWPDVTDADVVDALARLLDGTG
jgi:hypothetical protein